MTGPVSCWKRITNSDSALAADAQEQHVGDEVDQVARQIGPALQRERARLASRSGRPPALDRAGLGADVGAVDRECDAAPRAAPRAARAAVVAVAPVTAHDSGAR